MANDNTGDRHVLTFSGPEDEAAFVRLMLDLIDRHKLQTGEFIGAHIRAFDDLGASDMADFWRGALSVYEQAYAIGEKKARGKPLLTSVK